MVYQEYNFESKDLTSLFFQIVSSNCQTTQDFIKKNNIIYLFVWKKFKRLWVNLKVFSFSKNFNMWKCINVVRHIFNSIIKIYIYIYICTIYIYICINSTTRYVASFVGKSAKYLNLATLLLSNVEDSYLFV